ncbi:hypothetical protein INT45_010010 [Circinella minor]|uniref:Uncharacterized protein n=1 Tax=Circinella minor TaxID=1195481 RepID=A0A8H7S8N6_9FUNG|nr:hypothetical protein INT45_010010 [Circinella minor]
MFSYRGDIPRLDTIVTVENCYYYMSLLESFYNIEQSLGPELFKLYVIAAERRYLEFIRIVGKRDTLERWNSSKQVPLDIAYAWHAHLMAPYQYKDDICPDSNFAPLWSQPFPLQPMHKQRRDKDKKQKDYYDKIWTRHRDVHFYIYPFVLTKEELEQTSLDNNPTREQLIQIKNGNDTLEGETHERRALYIHCGSCSSKIYFESWLDYASFRTDPTVVVKCPSFICKHPENTVDSLSISNVLASLPFKVSGTKLDSDGAFKDEKITSKEKPIQERIDKRIKKSKDVFYGSKDMNAMLNCIANSEGNGKTNIINASGDKSYCKEFSNIVESTHKNNPMGLSLDLVQAMLDQREYIHTMVTKIAPRWENPEKHDIPNAINDYHDFLLLLKVQKDPEVQNAILPTWAIDMVWRTHLLFPFSYRDMMLSQLGRAPNHNTSVLHSHLENSFTITKNAWNKLPSSFTRSIDFGKMAGSVHRKISHKATRNFFKYNQLKNKCVNSNMKKKMSTLLLEDLSHHGSSARNDTPAFISESKNNSNEKRNDDNDNKKQTSSFLPITIHKESQSNLIISETLACQVREEIYSKISHTGYGYIGPRNPHWRITVKRMYGRIPPGSTIAVYHKRNPERFLGQVEDDYYSKRTDLQLIKPLKSEEKKYEWWVASWSLYGMMRRKYSKKHKQWGWTTDGLDWYSETECQFTTCPSGKFTGSKFFPNMNARMRKGYSGYASTTNNTTTGSTNYSLDMTSMCGISNFDSCDTGGGSSGACGSGGGGDSGGGGGGGGDSGGGGGCGGGGGGCGGGGGD